MTGPGDNIRPFFVRFEAGMESFAAGGSIAASLSELRLVFSETISLRQGVSGNIVLTNTGADPATPVNLDINNSAQVTISESSIVLRSLSLSAATSYSITIPENTFADPAGNANARIDGNILNFRTN